MAKEFKEFDKKYAAYQGVLMDWERNIEGLKDSTLFKRYDPSEGLDKWVWHFDPITTNMEEIGNAVYKDEGFEDWQKFRVSLKGNNTREKLYRLDKYLWRALDIMADTQVKANSADMCKAEKQFRIEKVRVHNYIGALKRSGHLDNEGNIVKER